MFLVIFGFIGITLVLFIILGVLFRVFSWPGWIAFIIAVFLAIVIKWAFMDSFILTRTMAAYMKIAPSTSITVDLYGKLCGISNKFKELFNRGQGKQPAGESKKIEAAKSAKTTQTKKSTTTKKKPSTTKKK